MFIDRSPHPPAAEPVVERTHQLRCGESLAYWDTDGDGPAVVLCHPHTGNLQSWEFQRPALVAAGFRVIGYSRRGYHGSSPCRTADPGTQAGDLTELLDHLDIARAHILGLAAGGSTALDFVLSQPERTLSAIVGCSLMSIDETEPRELLASLRGDWFKLLPASAKELSADYRALCLRGLAEWERIRALNPAIGLDERMQPLHSTINWSSLAANSVPLLLLSGSSDLYMPPRVLEEISTRVGASTFAEIAGAAHAPHVETPEAFNAAVLAFLTR